MPSITYIYDETGKRLTIDKLVTGKNKTTWIKSLSMKLGCLAHINIHGVLGTDTIDFI